MGLVIKVGNCEIIDEGKFSDEFEIFKSIVLHKGEQLYFSRKVKNRCWDNSEIIFEGDSIGFGEDPRAFLFNEKPACYTVTYKKNRGWINKIAIKDNLSWSWHFLINIEFNLPPGKNWSPFVYMGEVYFLHGFNPPVILKAKLSDKADNTAVLCPHYVGKTSAKKNLIDRYSVYRGGSNALELDPGVFFGFGHTNTTTSRLSQVSVKLISVVQRFLNLFKLHSIKLDNLIELEKEKILHRPFVWSYDINRGRFETTEINHEWNDNYKIIDPTSFVKIEDEYFLYTCETEHIWGVSRPQNYRHCKYKIKIELDSVV